MEQNLSEKERKQRLLGGLIFEALALTALLQSNTFLALVLGVAGLGLIFNYFTCFCGTKKAVKSLKSRLT
ncbi:MAG: protein of unknown function, DUF2892 [Candidatus Nanosalina sp. J07AB43]|nr:MAG: protein of unknown function, DUF2892 [Candidatus Nanosalina sp. J07AB43]